MELKKIRAINGFLLCNIAFQLVFLAAVFFFQNVILIENSVFYRLTYEEWNWLLARESAPYERAVMAGFMLLKYAVILVDLAALFHVYLSKKNAIPVPVRWKALLPLAGVLVYVPCFLYIRFQAPHFLLFMDLVPAEVLSLVTLCLLGAGRARAAYTAS